MSDYEAMKAELEANGYSIMRHDSINDTAYISVYVGYPDDTEFIGKDYRVNDSNYPELKARCTRESIDKAWEHYQREKKYKAMEALLDEVWHGYIDSEPDYVVTPIDEFEEWLDRVKTILGK